MVLINYNGIPQFILKAVHISVKAERVNVVVFLRPIEGE